MQETDFKQLLTEGAILTFDKPLGWSSFDVVNKVRLLIRHILDIKKLKAGHAGTLDPLATGLLIICTGTKTKNIEKFQDFEKEYTGTFTIGQTTPSFDLETKPDASFPISHITDQMAYEAAKKLSGNQKQIPPLFSAKKIEGKRAYEMARRGDSVVLKANDVFIRTFEITRFELPEADFRVVCSKGTYIRSLARDFGQAIGSGAHLKCLRRTCTGDFDVQNAWTIDGFEKHLLTLVNKIKND